MAILFYSTNDAYGCFSNFSAHGLQLKGTWWPTSEHYFQAQKFAGTAHEEAIRLAKTPNQAARMGRERSRPLRRDWEQIKDQVMLDALRQKFRTHADIRQILLDTGAEDLVENAPGDYYWGIGADGSGRNMLGRLLMQVRAELRLEAGGKQLEVEHESTELL